MANWLQWRGALLCEWCLAGRDGGMYREVSFAQAQLALGQFASIGTRAPLESAPVCLQRLAI